MEWMLEHSTLMLIIAGAFGFLMAWGVGANDVANAMGTSVGAGALTVKKAILIAIVFEFCGAYFAGGEVTETVRKGIIESGAFDATPHYLVYGMMAALLSAGIWLVAASWFGWPVSTTHSIVGAIVGFAAVGVGPDAVQWGEVGSIVASWVTSPLLAGFISFALIKSVQRLVLNQDDPFAQAKKVVPFYMFLVGFVISMVTLVKGLKHLGLHLSFAQSAGLAVIGGLLVSVLGLIILRRIKPDPEADKDFRFSSVERVFAVLMIFTACAMAFAHGSNDVANAVGPLAAINSIIVNQGVIGSEAVLPGWILLLGAMGIVFGLAILGARVMATVGTKITALTPSRGFAAELGAATTVVLASGTGLPISTTHTLVGAVLGVGMARGIGSLNLRVIGTIFTSWIVTLPAGALLSILFFYFFKGLFGA
ncbi:inorganic phosphate transporter [Alloalcanivorax mobilis]|uniref:inorganic phosphate transporter n=1 Tax=Alloalcanivorax mobilis TaxID=2019569 RepID=UPI000B5B10D9|nr:inorganic phosphate transporter [Alloalcanivorax mobilis]ASK35504.1 phosphate permease [Alcanivorax sp. N3-2A]|tara:strand:+ start:13074 stop:14342 length:1269 start_codon:yes stop_codon:yes gene_type:complete